MLSSQNIGWPIRIDELHNHLKTIQKWLGIKQLTKGQFSRCDLSLVEDSISLLVKRRVTTLRFYKVRSEDTPQQQTS